MIVITLCAMLAMRQQQADAPVARASTPGKMISMAFQHYADAKSIGGHIRLSQSAKSLTIYIDTDLAFDTPSQLLVQQAKGGSEPRKTLIVSDGKRFSYDKPAGTYGQPRFVEDVDQLAGSQDVKEMYGTAAITLDDRVATDIVFARNVDLKEVMAHWTSLKFGQKVTIRGVDANTIEGDYTENPGEASTGTFTMAITDSGDILQYTVKNKYAVPTQSETILVTSVWDFDLKVNGKNDPKIYTARG